jgi:hypothetical protein
MAPAAAAATHGGEPCFRTEADRPSNQLIQDRLVSALGGEPENICSG